ncbi:ephexin-1 [Astyanax mexicanus]|uniref:ephexin-1 n=1 Tax=Astyanax mexicanus TaxID=7994 RepID=UPI0020CB079D|nr:ephexin-1 [Astyanax mexicanus]XP_049338061.1 ephexin-1 [Astyanax mexicanus]XP_049338117.1 ephexin-1 [Astyanax mexicanus]XP_049338158.1 ephexin-1 [Astyanax mexicanus]XP_049338192.1 ephexin-1 [Astyanax mexicanus]XP_049338258.1 ephexin-1 [Astyanax mexicanus]XP_049338309.1 ephexin-1 [Astyanax mexicanus]XP_049338379.1 ephexin-1 [Astyanax mexicanus]XP_049338417.1 ephexin-1 [Astyanax mexicanus]XP_049338442.1 ephexin-1 [Astyanax mexicanus]XP_049338455.1 ephexin-1 [Astyanax mexicanus]XP_049338
MSTPKPHNVHHKPSLPPKPSLQSQWGSSSAPWPVPRDLRIKPGMVKERTQSLIIRGEGLNRKPPAISKTHQLPAGTVRDQVQKLDLAPPTGSKQVEEKGRRAWMKDQVTSHVEHGRSEPDGSEMEDGVGGVRLEEEGSVTPSCPLQEKHCHCICHLHRPGMKLMWVPDDHSNSSLKQGDHRVTSSKRQMDGGDAGVSGGVSANPTYTHSNSPTVAECINCQSFRRHHGRQSAAESESLYEKLDDLVHRSAPTAPPAETHHTLQADQPPAEHPEEPLYLVLQPSDERPATPPIPPPRPDLPPRPQSSPRTNQKERRATQPVLAYVLSPRGGRPPIRTSSSCEKRSPGKTKLEKKKSDRRDSADKTEVKQGGRKISSDWVQNSDYEPLYQIYQKKAEAELQGESPQVHRRSLSDSLGLQDSGSRGRHGAQLTNIKLWQDLPVVQESGILPTLTHNQRQRQECMFEVLTSEASYLRSLRVLRDHFLGSRELDDTLVIHDRKVLFSNILQVYEVSERFLQDLLDRVDEGVVISDVCDIIHWHANQHFSVYIDYVRNQVYQEKTYSQLMQCNRAFCTVMRRLEESPLCKRLPFSSFMLLPFQRITRIKILIQSILKRTTEGSAEEESASRALAVVSEIIREANTQVGQMKQMEELMHVANILEFDKLKAIPLVSKTRCLEKQGELQELVKGASLFGQRFRFTPVYIFLFNDLIILTARKSVSPERFVVLDHAHRSLVEVQPIEPSGPQLDHTFCLTLLENHQGNTCEHLLKANTESDLHRWMAVFPSVCELQQEKQEKVYEDWDCPQVQCIQQYAAKQADELSLEPWDIINIIRKTNEGWYEGMRLSDRARGWFPQESVVEVTNEHQRRRNLREQYRINMATRPDNHKEETKLNQNS